MRGHLPETGGDGSVEACSVCRGGGHSILASPRGGGREDLTLQPQSLLDPKGPFPVSHHITSVPIPAPQLLTIKGPASPSNSVRTWWTNADQRKMQVRTQVAIRNGVSTGKGMQMQERREGILLRSGAGFVLV